MGYNYVLRLFYVRRATAGEPVFCPAMLFQQAEQPPNLTQIVVFQSRAELIECLRLSELLNHQQLVEADSALLNDTSHDIDLTVTSAQAASLIPQLNPEPGRVTPSPEFARKVEALHSSKKNKLT